MTMTIGHMARFMKQLLPVEIPDTYRIHPLYLDVASDSDIRRGVVDFRDFIHVLCDGLITDAVLSAVPKKGKVKYDDDTTLTVEFPFINNIRSILVNIGQYGVLSGSGQSLTVESWNHLSLKRSLNKKSTTKISNAQMLKSLRFLETCGLRVQGIDLESKKPDLTQLETISISYPAGHYAVIGWKVLGLAQYEFSNRKHDDILLRCDYRMLSREKGQADTFIDDFVHPLQAPLQRFVRDAHDRAMALGMTCDVEMGFFCTHLIYSHKKKAIWRFSTSLHNGYRLVLKTKNDHKYPEVIDSFTPALRDTIRKGYGCDRKSGTSHGNCTHGCEGFRFALDEELVAMGDEIKTWQACELASMKR